MAYSLAGTTIKLDPSKTYRATIASNQPAWFQEGKIFVRGILLKYGEYEVVKSDQSENGLQETSGSYKAHVRLKALKCALDFAERALPHPLTSNNFKVELILSAVRELPSDVLHRVNEALVSVIRECAQEAKETFDRL